jgi:hypothetical protein
MTGPDHYREAERLLEQSMSRMTVDPERRVRIISRAQVHATLAVAAAVALRTDELDWRQVADTGLSNLARSGERDERDDHYPGLDE